MAADIKTLWDGQGSDTLPWLIKNQSDLEKIQENLSDNDGFAGRYFQLDDDIVLDETWTGLGDPVIGHAATESPYVEGGSGFAGTLRGGDEYDSYGHFVQINRTVFNRSGVGGLVNYLDPRGTVERLTVIGTLTVVGSVDAVGGVVGYNSGRIYKVTNQAAVTAVDAFNVGGIAGFNNGYYGSNGKEATSQILPKGDISHCINHGAVEGDRKVGGITGEDAGIIEVCANVKDLISSDYDSKNGVGGIAGRNGNNNTPVEQGRILNCYNTGTIKDTAGSWIGGIEGFQNAKSTTTNTYNIGYVIGRSWVDNTAGDNDNNATKEATNFLDPDGKKITVTDGIPNSFAPDVKEPNGDLADGAQNYDYTQLWSVSDMKSSLAAALNDGTIGIWYQPEDNYPILLNCGNGCVDISKLPFAVDIVSLPFVTNYVCGEKLDFRGLKIEAIYPTPDGNRVAIEDLSYDSEYAAGSGNIEITVRCTYQAVEYTLCFTITVSKAGDGPILLGSDEAGHYGTFEGALSAAYARLTKQDNTEDTTVYIDAAVNPASGTYGKSKEITIKRASGYRGAMLELDGTAVTLHNLKFVGDDVTAEGGDNTSMIRLNSGSLTLESTVTLQDNSIPAPITAGKFDEYRVEQAAWGAAVGVFGGTLCCAATIKNCKTTKGGAFYVTDGALNLLKGCIIQYCTATEDGSAVYLEGGLLHIADGVHISQNTAKDNGTIYVTYNTDSRDSGKYRVGTATMIGGTITQNTAEKNGAAVYIKGGAFVAKGGVINNGGHEIYVSNLIEEKDDEEDVTHQGTFTIDEPLFSLGSGDIYLESGCYINLNVVLTNTIDVAVPAGFKGTVAKCRNFFDAEDNVGQLNVEGVTLLVDESDIVIT